MCDWETASFQIFIFNMQIITAYAQLFSNGKNVKNFPFQRRSSLTWFQVVWGCLSSKYSSTIWIISLELINNAWSSQQSTRSCHQIQLINLKDVEESVDFIQDAQGECFLFQIKNQFNIQMSSFLIEWFRIISHWMLVNNIDIAQ